MSATLRRVGGLTAAATLAITAGAIATAGSALAYPTPAGALSGTCSPSTVTGIVGSTPGTTLCTFTLDGKDGNAAAGHVVTFAPTGGTVDVASATTGTDGTVSTTLSPSACSTVGATSATVKATVASGDKTLSASTQAYVTVSCTKAPTTVTASACTMVDSAGDTDADFPGYDEYSCSFASTAPAGTPVSFAVGANPTPTKKTSPFTFAGDQQTGTDGSFSTLVEVRGGYEGTVSLTGAVSATSTSDSASATTTISH